MESLKFRYLLLVHWRQAIVLLCFSLFWIPILIGQGGKNTNYMQYRNKDYYFGISLGFNASKHQVFQSKRFIGNPQILLARGAAEGGFNVHGIANYKIGEYFDVRSLPGFTFSTRHLDFNDNRRISIESIFVDLPFQVRYKSAPYKDKRAYVLAGINYAYDVQSNSKTREANEFIKISPHDFQLEAGFGIQLFFPYFILSPEIKFSQGINNILLFNDQLLESTVIEKLLSRVLTISFHFEG